MVGGRGPAGRYLNSFAAMLAVSRGAPSQPRTEAEQVAPPHTTLDDRRASPVAEPRVGAHGRGIRRIDRERHQPAAAAEQLARHSRRHQLRQPLTAVAGVREDVADDGDADVWSDYVRPCRRDQTPLPERPKVDALLQVLHRLVDHGNTVIVIEHNLDVIRTADWIIDLGPEGGDGGGRVVAKGTPKHICRSKKSYTGKFLRKKVKRP